MASHPAPRTLDLGCDWGESFGPWSLGATPAILEVVSSVHLACGQHAGDPLTMARSVAAAAAAGVAIGAHPGWPDLVGFGRRELACSSEETHALVLYQLGALAAFTTAAGVPLVHVKPHGALYLQAQRESEIALAVARAVHDFDPDLLVITQANGALAVAAASLGLGVARELFADRRYEANGSLSPRALAGAVLDDPKLAAAQVLEAVETGAVTARTGERVEVNFETVCIHGDGPHALDVAQAVRGALEGSGVTVTPLTGVARPRARR